MKTHCSIVQLRRPLRRNRMTQRAVWHDYLAPSIYMLTLSKEPEIPALSQVVNRASSGKIDAQVELSDVGNTINSSIELWLKQYSVIRLLNLCIMPDHLHLLIYVTERTEEHLSIILKKFRWKCNEIYGEKIFEDGYNDKIVTKEGQKDVFYHYVIDNPRRYLARKLFPEYFQRVEIIEIEGQKFSLFGNLFLLNHPVKTVVRHSRRYTQAEIESKNQEYDETLRCGGVFVSPFIHEKEKNVRKKAIEAGSSIIQVMLNGFSERFKPSGKDFDLCLEGRLLMIAPIHHDTRRVALDRSAALAANEVAALVVSKSVLI